MRAKILTVASAVFLAGCAAQNPDDGTQYFDSVNPNAAALTAEEQNLAVAEGATPAAIAAAKPRSEMTPAQQLDAALARAAAENAAPGSAVGPATAGPENRADISNSQQFRQVTSRETIESDAARIAALKAQYQVVDPTQVSVPVRSGGVNLADYALKQKNAVGEQVYKRFGGGLSGCSRYKTKPEEAQRVFLANGGPEKDRRRLDTDGDGFACGWNPDFYRNMLRTNG